MRKLRTLSLFAGIGGFDLGLERTGGFETVAFCEIDPFCQEVLAKHWPNVPCFSDVRELRGEQVGDIDVICGGFPCQDLSTAGKQAGMDEGTRSGLWSEIVRLAGELRPSFVIVENVAALLRGPSDRPGRWFGRVLGDLVAIGYDAEWHCIPASYIGACHHRDRAWIVAYPAQERQPEARGFRHNEPAQRFPRSRETDILANLGQARAERLIAEKVSGVSAFSWCQDVRRIEDLRDRPDIPTPLFRGSRDGVPNWVDRVGACGNAVVPQIPEMIGHAILDDIGWTPDKVTE